jgi:mannose-1-phosphate guanylyltransferase / mannose-6-phosphate isomerase
MRTVVLSGGSGTRLWPVSRKALPKQFVPLLDGKSLLQMTLERLALLDSSFICVASEDHRFLVQDTLKSAGLQGQVLLEPSGRNTAAAMAIAALQAVKDTGSETLMLFCPADHHIPDVETFAALVRKAVPEAQSGSLVTFGVVPSFPSTAYGYIEQGAARASGAHAVQRFIEKPDAAKASELLLHGHVLWNAGIFLCRADVLLQQLQQHAPDILASCETAMQGAHCEGAFVRPQEDAFLACRSQSIDYAVMERSDKVVVLPFDGIWNDVGSWNAVADLEASDDAGNRVQGHGMVLKSRNTFIHAPERTVVALGTEDLLIVDTVDAVLVVRRDHAEQVKEVVAQLEKQQKSQAHTHRRVARPWGWYDSLAHEEGFQVKRITVKPGASLSLQLHKRRSEHWVVVKGQARVVNGDQVLLLKPNQSTFAPVGVKHRLENIGDDLLEIIEVQCGAYLGEDDIVRLEDVYGRAPA